MRKVRQSTPVAAILLLSVKKGRLRSNRNFAHAQSTHFLVQLINFGEKRKQILIVGLKSRELPVVIQSHDPRAIGNSHS